jgi:hypothetical protein
VILLIYNPLYPVDPSNRNRYLSGSFRLWPMTDGGVLIRITANRPW